MTHASLFSGIGGFDLAAEWAGWTNLFHCEIDPFCLRILKHHFPNAESYTDIRTTDFTVWRGSVDVLTGGFPCQPFSVAGKRRGTEDERHLWPEMLRGIREIRPRWVVGENVLGIVSWSDGLVFEAVCTDLEVEGYEVLPFVLPAASVDAPHLRYRTWFVAHRADAGHEARPGRFFGSDRSGDVVDTDRERCGEQQCAAQPEGSGQFGGRISSGIAPDANSNRWRNGASEQKFVCGGSGTSDTCRFSPFERFPTESPFCRRDDEFSSGLDGITVPKWRCESIKAYGNAVVPELVRRIFDTINEYESITKTDNKS